MTIATKTKLSHNEKGLHLDLSGNEFSLETLNITKPCIKKLENSEIKKESIYTKKYLRRGSLAHVTAKYSKYTSNCQISVTHYHPLLSKYNNGKTGFYLTIIHPFNKSITTIEMNLLSSTIPTLLNPIVKRLIDVATISEIDATKMLTTIKENEPRPLPSLKPCPYCKSNAKVVEHPKEVGNWRAYCNRTGCRQNLLTSWKASEITAYYQWNQADIIPKHRLEYRLFVSGVGAVT